MTPKNPAQTEKPQAAQCEALRSGRGAKAGAQQDPLVFSVDPSRPPRLPFVFSLFIVAAFAQQCLNRSLS